ncbi:MAG: 30S ribosomal protein S12 methylthiotransferase RimO [Gammaproteobacteria bacterium]|nr:30S ribosomal protein S12 methylthiotransferase RimO [Gammaproteobacteria bacterium]
MSKSAPSVGFVSLGCPKALVDSERLLTQLSVEGYAVAPEYEAADVVIVNTCGFIDAAVEESMESIGEAIERNGQVIVTGCLGARKELIEQAFPQVLAVTGPHAYADVMNAVHAALPPTHDPFVDLLPPTGVKLTPRHYAYLKISEGCNHRCSFCIIPSMRGDLVSRPIDEVLGEASALVDAGVRELLVISQDTSAYGVDLKYRPTFWNGRPYRTKFQDLCAGLGELDAWVRLHYVYPYPHVDDVIPLMANGDVLPYLDIPFQHASPAVLKRMRRPAHAENTLERVHAWRDVCPELTIRSTFIVGFPGETDEDFEMLLEWMKQARLDRVGCFQYSPVEGAAANALAGAVPDDVKEQRWHDFMSLATQISRERLAAKVGNTMAMLVDEVDDTGGIIGRGAGDAPDIDGVIHASGGEGVLPGDFVDVAITDADDYDLFGEVLP